MDVYMAKLAEQAERYDEMVEYMKTVANTRGYASTDLDLEERNLLSVAYKNVVGARRASLRIIGSIEAKEKEKNPDGEYVTAVQSYKTRVEKELNDICEDILALLSSSLVKFAAQPEAKVFYLKMKADYYRYLAEFTGNKESSSAKEAATAYKEATAEAHKLAPTHPIRLGLALN